jgi:hypothetical protein
MRRLIWENKSASDIGHTSVITYKCFINKSVDSSTNSYVALNHFELPSDSKPRAKTKTHKRLSIGGYCALEDEVWGMLHAIYSPFLPQSSKSTPAERGGDNRSIVHSSLDDLCCPAGVFHPPNIQSRPGANSPKWR